MMTPPDNMLYEYAVVRYVPRVDREEFMNIGLIMMCKRRKWLKGRVEIDEMRVKAFDPQADTARLESQASMFMRQDVPDASFSVEEKYRWLSAVKSAVLQVSPSHPGIAVTDDCNEDSGNAICRLEEEFGRLFDDLVSVGR